ncbi:hypothetical protein JW826_05180 [Candidatus Woesearchaeota archaeon]|nr:hypothetical protein [Candidatus Woesearchaeota archaeon]
MRPATKRIPAIENRTSGQRVTHIALLTLTMICILTMTLMLALVLTPMTLAATTSTTTEFEAQQMIARAEKSITDIKSSGHQTPLLDDLLVEMKLDMLYGDYDKVSETYNTTKSHIDKLTALEDMTKQIESLMEEAIGRGINITGVSVHYNIGVGEFKKNSFETAERELSTSKELLVNSLKNQSADMKSGLEALENLNLEQELGLSIINKSIAEVSQYEERDDYMNVFATLSKTSQMNESLHQIIILKETINRLEAEGKRTERFNDQMRELMTLFEEEDYAGLGILFNETQTIIYQAKEVVAGLAEIDQRLASPEVQGIDFTEAQELLEISKEELALENYEKSRDYMDRAKSLIEEIEKEHLLTTLINKSKAKYNPVKFLKENWLYIILGVLMLRFFTKVSMSAGKIAVYEHQIRKLEREQEVIIELMRGLQEEYYLTKEIDKDTYEAEKANFEQRSSEINKEFPVLTAKIKKEQDKLAKVFSFMIRSKKKRRKEKSEESKSKADNQTTKKR